MRTAKIATMTTLLSLGLGCAQKAMEPEDMEVAAIMLVQGQVRIRHDAGDMPATVGTGLHREDIVQTGTGAAAILHLKNNYLVRVDEEIELAVADIVLLGADEIDLDASEQLASLLYPEERDQFAGLQDAERVAGWQSRMSAGEAPAAGVEEDEESEDPSAEPWFWESNEEAPAAAAESAPAPSATAEAKPKKKKAKKEKNRADSGARDSKVLDETEAEAPDDSSDMFGDGGLGLDGIGTVGNSEGATGMGSGFGGASSTGGREQTGGGGGAGRQTAGGDAPAVVDELEKGLLSGEKKEEQKQDKVVDLPNNASVADRFATGDLKTCLDTWATGQPVDVGEVHFTIRHAGGTISRVVADKGLTVPGCLRELRGTSVTDAPSPWVVVYTAPPK